MASWEIVLVLYVNLNILKDHCKKNICSGFPATNRSSVHKCEHVYKFICYIFVSFVSVHTAYTCIKCSVINYRISNRTDILDSARPDYIRVSCWNRELTQTGTYMSKSRQGNSMCTVCNMKQLKCGTQRIISRHPTAMISGNWFIEENF